MNCVEFTLRGTYTTTKTLVHIHNGSSASEASCRLCLYLLLGKYEGCITEGLLVDGIVMSRDLSAAVIIMFNRNVFFIKLDKIVTVTSDRQACMWLYKAVDTDCRLFAGCDRINCKLRSGLNISTNEDIRLRRLVGKRICNGSVAASELYLLTV